MTTFSEVLNAPDSLAAAVLEDGRVVATRMKLNGPELTVSTPEDLALGIVSDAWEYAAGPGGYASLNGACGAAHRAWCEWVSSTPPQPAADFEPSGWTRHVATGRRRPGGDATREYVRS